MNQSIYNPRGMGAILVDGAVRFRVWAPNAAKVAVLGDFNLVGPALLPGFRDVGPRAPTHRMVDMLPIRLDRCLARGLECVETRVLPHLPSDHHPIRVRLRLKRG